MAEGVTACRLRSGDAALLAAMNALFAKAFADAASYCAAPPSEAYLDALLGKEHFIALAALAEDAVVGGLVAYELDKFEQERREIYIYDLAVGEAYRRRGVATALLARLKEIARARDAWVIYVQADYGDEAAIALYARLGRREDVMHFDIDPE